MRGTIKEVNKALLRPLLIAGVEKRLMLANATLCFPLIAATKFHFPACLVGFGIFAVIHGVLILVAKHDPNLGQVIRRATRYISQSYYPARSHPLKTYPRPIKTVSRPWM